MKRILLAGTALAAVSAATAAQVQVAQAQIKVMLGGYTEFFAGIYDDDVGNRTSHEFELETEIVVRADGKADNGLLYGAKVELQNSSTGPAVATDEASVYLGGSWGRLELGDFDGASDTMSIYAPVVGIEQIDGEFEDFLGATSGGLRFGDSPWGNEAAKVPDSSDATKVMYLTPRIVGLQAGISYAPQGNSQAQSVVALKSPTDYKDFLEFGVNYERTVGDFKITLGATGSTASGQSAGGTQGLEDFFAWQIGGQASYAGFTVGGSYIDADDFNRPTTGAIGGDQYAWNAGIAYKVGSFSIAASYLQGEGYKAPAGTPATTFADDYKLYGVGLAYTVAPGLMLESDLLFVDEELTGGTAAAPIRADNDGYVLILGTRLSF